MKAKPRALHRPGIDSLGGFNLVERKRGEAFCGAIFPLDLCAAAN